jgi:hypothetical protein
MLRTPVALCGGALLLAIVAALPAQADEMPIRKAGLWEVKSSMRGVTAMVGQLCTDEAFEKEMSGVVPGQMGCSTQEVRKTASGYVIDSVCTALGKTVTSHAEITGDMNSAYTRKIMMDSQLLQTEESRWLGACNADQKPGEMVTLPGGMFKAGTKLNIRDMVGLA